jgi:hypothetical protein
MAAHIVGALAGYIIVFLFILTALYAYSTTGFKLKLSRENTNTISDIAANPAIRPYVQAGCYIIALLNIPFMIGLNSRFGLFTSPVAMIVGCLSSALLVFTGLTVALPRSYEHYFFSLGFCGFLFFDGIIVSSLLLRYVPSFGWVNIMIDAVTLITAGYMLLKYKLSGVSELSFLGLNSLWIILSATAMLI